MCKGGSRTTNTQQNTHTAQDIENWQNSNISGLSQAEDANMLVGGQEAVARARDMAGRPITIPRRNIAEADPWMQTALDAAQIFGRQTENYAVTAGRAQDSARAASAQADNMLGNVPWHLNRAQSYADRAGNELSNVPGLLYKAQRYVDQAGGREVGLRDLDVDRYYNPYASSVFAGLNQNLGIEDAKMRSANKAVSEALKFQQDQLARGQLGAQLYDRALQTAQQQQGAHYAADVGNRDNLYRAASGTEEAVRGWQNNAAALGGLANNSLGTASGFMNAATGYGNSANNWLQNSASLMRDYQAGQNARMGAGQYYTNYRQQNLDADYEQQQRQLEEPWRRQQMFAELASRLAPITGIRTNQSQDGHGYQSGRGYTGQFTTQTQQTEQSPMSAIAGTAMAALGAMTGNPMAALGAFQGGSGGWQSLFGGGSTPDYGQTANQSVGNYMMPIFGRAARGGRINPYAIRKQGGGALGFDELSEPVREALRNGTFMPRAEEDRVSDWPPSIPESRAGIGNFNDRASPHISAIDDGDYDPAGANYTDFRGSGPMVASNEGRIPLPASRPEGAGPAFASPEFSSSNPYSPPRSSAAGPMSGGDGIDTDIPRTPTFKTYERPQRNWSEFLLRAGLATLAARGQRDSSGIPTGGETHIAKGLMSALDDERKDRSEAMKEVDAQNDSIKTGDSALRWRTEADLRKKIAEGSTEERRLAREELKQHREQLLSLSRDRLSEAERTHKVNEDLRRITAEARREQVATGKPYSDDAIIYKAQVRADNKVKAGVQALTLRSKEEIDAEWQRTYNETYSALKQGQTEAIGRMRGNPAAPAAAPAPAPAPQAEAMPPPEAVARLKAGSETRFANGQVWTLGPDGKPQRVR
jgi:hypothetical protein